MIFLQYEPITNKDVSIVIGHGYCYDCLRKMTDCLLIHRYSFKLILQTKSEIEFLSFTKKYKKIYPMIEIEWAFKETKLSKEYPKIVINKSSKVDMQSFWNCYN